MKKIALATAVFWLAALPAHAQQAPAVDSALYALARFHSAPGKSMPAASTAFNPR